MVSEIELDLNSFMCSKSKFVEFWLKSGGPSSKSKYDYIIFSVTVP